MLNLKCIFGAHLWKGCKCQACSKTREQSHDWSTDCETCAVCGQTRRNHDWSDDCEKCANCSVTRSDAHNWDGCKCPKCGAQRDESHEWAACKCAVCGKHRDEEHLWKKCKCEVCGKILHKWKGAACMTCGTVRPLTENEFRTALLSGDMTLVSACVASPMGANANLAKPIRSEEFEGPLHCVARLFHDASLHGKMRPTLLQLAEYLLDHGADPSSHVWPGGDTPLHRVNYPEDRPFAALLFRHGANPSIKNYSTRTAAEECERRFECGPRRLGSSHVITDEEASFLDFLSTGRRQQEEPAGPVVKENKEERAPKVQAECEHARSEQATATASLPTGATATPVAKPTPTRMSGSPPERSHDDLKQVIASSSDDTPLARFVKGLVQEKATEEGVSDLYDVLRARSDKIYPVRQYPSRDDIRDALALTRGLVKAAPGSAFVWACHCLVLDCAVEHGLGVVKYEEIKPEFVAALDRVSAKYLQTCLVAGFFFSSCAATHENLLRSSGAFKLALTFDNQSESALSGLARLYDKHRLLRESLQYYELLARLFPANEEYGAAAQELRGLV